MSLAPERFYQVAVAILDAVKAAYLADGTDLPARQYVANGEVAFDCDQLVVQVPRIFTGLPGAEQSLPLKLASPVSMQAVVWLLRCVPIIDDGGREPTPEAIQESAQEILRDAALLRTGLIQGWQDGDLGSLCDSFASGPLTGVSMT